MTKVLEITDAQFEQEITNSDTPVLAYFWAGWCGPCRLVSPSIQGIAEQYVDRLKVLKLEVDSSPESVKRCQVEGVPAIRLFKDHEIVLSHEGAIGKQQLQTLLEKNL